MGRRAIGSIVGLMCCAALLPTAAASAASPAPLPLVWSQPTPIDALPPFSAPARLQGISCPSPTKCAIAAGHQLLSSSDPLGGFDAWHSTDLGSGLDMVGIACPTVAACVAVGHNVVVLVTGLWSGAPRRQALTLPGINSMWFAACPSTALCMLGDVGGRFVTSDDPFGWPATWSVQEIGRNISSLWCLGETICEMTDKGTLSMSPAPAGETWYGVDAGVFVQSVSCASASYCIAIGDQGEVASTSDPIDGAWTVTPGVGGWGSYCAPPSLCLSFAGDTVYSATDPGAGTIVWNAAALPHEASPLGGACPNAEMCLIAMDDGSLLTSTDPAGGGWSAEQIAGTNALTNVACPSAGFCLAFDDFGRTLVSQDPAAGPASWSPRARIDSGSLVLGLACPSASLCVAVASDGRILASTDPAGGTSAWTTASVGTAVPTDVACPAPTSCVAVDQDGRVLTSTAPAGGTGAWHVTQVDASPLTAIACPSTIRCIATDSAGRILYSDNPAGGASAWHATQVGPSALSGIACPSTTLCVAVDVDGAVLTSSDPAGGAAAWQRAPASGADGFGAVSCPSTSLCVAVDGDAVSTSTQPAAGGATWTTTVIDAGAALTDVTCPSPTLCVGIDTVGSVLLGTGPLVSSPQLPAVQLPTGEDPPAARPSDAARIRGLLQRALAGIRTRTRIRTLLKRNRYMLPLSVPVNGVASIRWTSRPRAGARAGRVPRAVVVARGSRTFARAGTATIAVRLTRVGRRLLQRAAHVRIVASATFAGAERVSVSVSLTLRR